MPLVFSPLSEDILSNPPRRLFPGHAFVMRQIGEPPAIDERMARIVSEVFAARGVPTKDADASTGGGDWTCPAKVERHLLSWPPVARTGRG